MNDEHSVASLPNWCRSAIESCVPVIATVPGVVAIVLGGSHASGRAVDSSDLDLGLLYHDAEPIDIAALQLAVEEFNDDVTTKVTTLGGWGPWVNGGGWLRLDDRPVDVLYRSIDRYHATIDNAYNGFAEHDYLQQPPFGFQSTIYLGEIDAMVTLAGEEEIVRTLKSRVRPYPAALKHALTKGYQWGAEFSVQNARKPAARGDIYAVSGCLSRAVAFLVQAMLAANEAYPLSDKGAVARVASLARCPEEWSTVESLLSLDPHPATLTAAVDSAEALVRSCAPFTNA